MFWDGKPPWESFLENVHISEMRTFRPTIIWVYIALLPLEIRESTLNSINSLPKIYGNSNRKFFVECKVPLEASENPRLSAGDIYLKLDLKTSPLFQPKFATCVNLFLLHFFSINNLMKN